jgi:hypothetical protein
MHDAQFEYSIGEKVTIVSLAEADERMSMQGFQTFWHQEGAASKPLRL